MIKYIICCVIAFFTIIWSAQNSFAQIKYKYGSPITIGTATAKVVSVDAGLFNAADKNSDALVGFFLIVPSTKSSVGRQIIYKILSRPNSSINIQYGPRNGFNSSNDGFFNLRNNFGDIIKVRPENNATNNIVFFGKDGVNDFAINFEFLIDSKKFRGNYKADYYLVASY